MFVVIALGDTALLHRRQTRPALFRPLNIPAGSIGPKVEAACRFVEDGGRFAAIGALGDAAAILRGEAGTIVRGSDD